MAVWQGKWALVTGASAGIGLELASQLAAGGANLVLTARRIDRLTQLADELRAKHQIQTEVFPADLAQPQAPDEIFRFTEEKHLPIDVLINNAGFGAYGNFYQVERQRFLDMVQVNVTAVVSLTHLYLPAMVARRSGYIMIVSSTAAFQAVPYISTYAATKAFDLLFAEGIAAEVHRHGVFVSALCPGSTESEFLQVANQPEHGRSSETSEKVARVGLEALAAGKSRVISGTGNWLGVEAQRLVPHGLVTRVVERMFAPKEK
jgi:short-subunit dehydrogenase